MEILQVTTKNITNILLELKKFKQTYQQEYRLKSLGIFGSYARKEAKENSDVDIFFETEQPNLFKTAHLRLELEELLGLPVDLVRLRNNMNPKLKLNIQKEGIYV